MNCNATLKLRRPTGNNIQGLYFETYKVIRCEYSFAKEVSKNGEVQSDVLAGNIHVTLPILPTEELLGWVFDNRRIINGEITINDAHEEVLEKIYFEEGRCVNFRLHYEPSGDMSDILLFLTINAQYMILGEVEYRNYRR
jgi:hypothetical protein